MPLKNIDKIDVYGLKISTDIEAYVSSSAVVRV